MTDHELHTAGNALAAEISNEITALARRSAAPLTESQQAATARAASLTAERERRDRAGVRVRTNADDLGERTIAHHLDVLNLAVAAMTQKSADVGTLATLLGRAVAMITQMGDALTAPERIADAKRLADDEAHAVWSRKLAADMLERQSAQLTRDRADTLAAQVRT